VAIHCAVHAARPDVVAAAHAHGPYGKTLSSLDMTIEPLTQDACAFYDDVGVYADYRGVVTLVAGRSEPRRALGLAKVPHGPTLAHASRRILADAEAGGPCAELRPRWSGAPAAAA